MFRYKLYVTISLLSIQEHVYFQNMCSQSGPRERLPIVETRNLTTELNVELILNL